MFEILHTCIAQIPTEQVLFAPQVLAALIGAVIGGFIASFLKEFFGDFFHKKRRLREIITEMTKNIGLFDSDFQMYCREVNTMSIESILASKVPGNINDPNVTKARYNHLAQVDKHRPTTIEYFHKITGHWANITALSFECQHYISRWRYKRLRKLYTEFHDNTKQYLNTPTLEEMDYSTLRNYRINNFTNDLNKRFEGLGDYCTTFIADVNNALH